MIAALRLIIAKYEIYFGLAIILIAIYSGWWLHGVFYDAAETEQLKTDLKNYQDLSKKYHDSSDAYQKLNQKLLDDQQNLMDKAHETKDPICGSKPIPPSRMHILKHRGTTLAAG